MPSRLKRIEQAVKSVLRLNKTIVKASEKESARSQLTNVVLTILTGSKNVTLRRLVKQASVESNQSRDKVLVVIATLRASGVISVEDSKPYMTFPSFITSANSFWFWEMVIATMSCLVVVLVSSGILSYVRFFVGGLFALFLPGYSLMSLVYPKYADFDGLARIVFSFMLSLAVVTLIGFALNYTSFGITLPAIMVSLGTFTLGMVFLTTVRRYSRYRLSTSMALSGKKRS